MSIHLQTVGKVGSGVPQSDDADARRLGALRRCIRPWIGNHDASSLSDLEGGFLGNKSFYLKSDRLL
jgi:hypothetical protein